MLRLGLCAVAGLTPLLILPGNYDPANLPQSVAIQLGLLALCALAGTRLDQLGPRSLALPLVAFLGWAALSIGWAVNRHEAAALAAQWACCALAYLLVLNLMRSAAECRPLLLCLFASGTLVASLGLLQFFAGVQWVPQAFPPAATFVNKNVAAQFVLAVAPLGLPVLLQEPDSERRTGRRLVFAGLLVMGGFLVAARTRSTWLGALVAAALLAAALRSPQRPVTRRFWLAAGVPAALFAVLLAWQAASLAKRGGAADANATSLTERLVIWRNSLEMVKDSPLRGVGLGNHPVVYPLYANRAAPDPFFGERLVLDFAHDDYLQITAELGLVGLALLSCFGLGVIRLASSLARRDAIALAATLSLAGLATDALFSFPAYRALPPLLVMIDCGVLAVLAREDAAPVLLPPGLGRLIAVAAIPALAVAGWHGLGWIRSDRHCLRMLEAQSRRDWPRVTAEGEAARRLDPQLKEPWQSLGLAALETGDPQRAAAMLQQAVERYPNDMNGLANLGQAAAEMGDAKWALACYRKVLAIKPNEYRIHSRVGTLLQTSGDNAGALVEHRRAAELAPGDAYYTYHHGVAAMQTGAYPEAQEALLRTLALKPNHALAHKALGILLLRVLGQAPEGVAHLRQALELDPQIKDADQMRELVRRHEETSAAQHR